jgi:hypothetical protein
LDPPTGRFGRGYRMRPLAGGPRERDQVIHFVRIGGSGLRRILSAQDRVSPTPVALSQQQGQPCCENSGRVEWRTR